MLKIYNLLPDAEKFLKVAQTEKKTDFYNLFQKYYFKPNKKILGPLFDDCKSWGLGWLGCQKIFKEINIEKELKRLEQVKKWGWPAYAKVPAYAMALADKSAGKPERANLTIKKMEKFFNPKFSGNLVLFFSFIGIDGYTRFDKGKNTIYLGLDFPAKNDYYFDILLAHELTHLVRDSRQSVLESYGAHLKMLHDEYIKKMTFAEHLINEGLAGYVSSRIYPQYKPWDYLFYSKKQYQWCVKNRQMIEKLVKEYVDADKDWAVFYREDLAGKDSPERLQYFYGFELIKKAAKKYPLKKLIFMPARKMIEEFLL